MVIIVQLNGSTWELYNIKEDPTELNNLSDKMPEKVKEPDGMYRDA